MATQARSAYGMSLRMGDGGSPETFTEIPEVGDIDGPGIEVETEDVTTHSSAASGANREFIPTLLTHKDCEFDLNYVSSDPMHIAMRQACQARTVKNFRLINPTATETISFAGIITGLPFSFPVAGAQKFKVSIKVSGGLTFS